MAEASFNKAVSTWIDAHSWPRSSPGSPDSVLLFIRRAAPGGTEFTFQSLFHYFEVEATHDKADSKLNGVRVSLSVPGYPKKIVLVGTRSYALTTEDGANLQFNISDVIKGAMSFKYVVKDSNKNIAMKYEVILPFAGDLDDTVELAPFGVSTQSGFTTAELETIPVIALSEPHLEDLTREENGVYSASETNVGNEFLEFLKQLAKDDNNVVIQRYYGSQYYVSIDFFSVFRLAGFIDPQTLTITAALFVVPPIISGPVRISTIQGSGHDGIKTAIDDAIAKGTAKVTTKRSQADKCQLYIDLAVSAKFYGRFSSMGDLHLLTLPF